MKRLIFFLLIFCLFFLFVTSFSSSLEKNVTSEKLPIENNQKVEFFGDTFDELLLNDTTYMCSISPLSVLKNYKNVFPKDLDVEVFTLAPIRNEKNYVALWQIENHQLYLCNIKFHREEAQKYYKDTTFFGFDRDPALNELYKNEYANRFKTIENFLNRKFETVPSLNKKAILADWYSGILYIKRIPKDCAFYNNSYEYEPFYKLIIEKGIIKSMEKTTYMITN